MKYEIVKLGMDEYELKYKDKSIKFNSKVEFVNDLQNATKNARLKMVKDLAKDGLTIKSLVVEQHKDGKTYVDNSNKEFMEEAYIQETQSEIFQDVIKKMLGMDLTELTLDIGFETEEEVTKFGEDIGDILMGRFLRNKGRWN